MITVLGAGNGGVALSCYFEKKGLNVTLWNRSENRLENIKKNENKIIVNNYELNIRETIKISKVTTDLELATKKSEYIFIVTPGFAHEDISKKLKELNIHNKVIFFMPGRTLGAKKAFEIIDNDSNMYFESQTILHTCRLEGNELLQYKQKPTLLYTGYNNTEYNRNLIHNDLIKLIPELKYLDNYYDISLNNIGAMLHPAPTLLNIGLVESKKEFFYYREAISPVIAKYIEKMDLERKKICDAYNSIFISVFDWLKIEYNSFGDTLYERLQNNLSYNEIKGPNSINHRYIIDDLLTGLVPLYFLAKSKNIEVPYIKNIIVLANNLLERDFFSEGRKET